MFICPHTGERLVKARAGGATIWYSPLSDGRMLNLEMARHFLGPSQITEIWMRSEVAATYADCNCPSCLKPMRETQLPDWIADTLIKVCRRCRVLWIEADQFTEKIPLGSQLLHAKGDSTLVKDLGESYIAYEKAKLELEAKYQDGATDAPGSVLQTVFGYLGLPIEKNNRLRPEWPLVSAVLIVGMFFVHWFFTTSIEIVNWGYYPAEPFKNFGFNIFSSAFLHSGWLHLIFNLYFAYILSDDVEEDLGWKKFVGFLFFVIVVGTGIQSLLAGSPEIPHIGYSAVVMGLFAYYGFQFPNSKMVWLLPNFKVFRSRVFNTTLWGWTWFQVRVLWVAGFYFCLDLARYLLVERGGSSGVSHSGHIGGFVAGYLFWKFYADKSFQKKPEDVFVKNLDRLVDVKTKKAETPKQIGPK